MVFTKELLLSTLALSSLAAAAPRIKPNELFKSVDQEGQEFPPHHKHHLRKRSSNCQFPNNEGMVAVQTSGKNAGWAMHDDQECKPGTWCPYACEPGQLMAQWDPSVTTYSYPGSQNGGLYCDSNGNLQKGNKDKDYCYEGKGTVIAKNSAGSDVAFCQTVLPGNEEMLIPTVVGSGSSTVLAVPGTEYWAGTAAHYYVNPPGVSVDDGCKWGSTSNPWGNWSPYVAGANMDDSGNTYVKIGWNPVYLEASSPFNNKEPEFGIRITCDDPSKCNGLPCSIDPTKQKVNQVKSSQSSDGAGGAAFCVVTAYKGAKANIEIFKP